MSLNVTRLDDGTPPDPHGIWGFIVDLILFILGAFFLWAVFATPAPAASAFERRLIWHAGRWQAVSVPPESTRVRWRDGQIYVLYDTKTHCEIVGADDLYDPLERPVLPLEKK